MSRGTPQITVRLPPELWERVGRAASAAGTDRGSLIRALLRWWLREPGATIPPRPAPPVDHIP